METILLILISLCRCTILVFLFSKASKKKLPPGPAFVPIFGNLLWLYTPFRNFKQIIRETHTQLGPIITFRIGSSISIFCSDRHIAHKMLIENGAIFADRPTYFTSSNFINNNNKNINGSPYGPLWSLLRRNLMTKVLHPSRAELFAPARSWALCILINKLIKESKSGELSVQVMESFHFAIFSLLLFMCFGQKLDEESVQAITVAQKNHFIYSKNLHVFDFAPFITKLLYRGRLKKASELHKKLKDVYVSLINDKREFKSKKEEREYWCWPYVHSYVSSLLDIKVPNEGGRNLTEDEIVGLCSEFATAGTDPMCSALQWVMAELVKNQEVQKTLFDEIKEIIGENTEEEIKEGELYKFPYLKAVVFESLRRHPPAHYTASHAVTEEIVLEGYTIPKNAAVNFGVAEINLDERIWPNPLEFKPERFLQGGEGEGVDITGTREIKMMPFGVGRRMCPGLSLALLHLEYFVVNLVKEFEWKSVDGEEVDFTERHGFIVVMKNPLNARVIPRRDRIQL